MPDIITVVVGLLPADYFVYLTIAVAVASALDAALPQPAADSPWYWPRRLVSLVAVNVGHAVNVRQPRRDGPGLPPSPLSLLFAVLLVGALALPLGACSGAQVGAALDTAGGTIDAAADVAADVADRIYAREVKLICRKSVRAHLTAIGDGVMHAQALPLICPDIRALTDSVKGAAP